MTAGYQGAEPLPAPPALPHTWRPRWGRWVSYAVALFIVGFLGTVTIALPVPWSDRSITFQRLLLLLVGIGGSLVVLAFARVRVAADEQGLTVVNAARRHRLAWEQVLGVRLTPDDPWVILDLSDGSTLPALGIQTADGERGRRAAAELAACVAERSFRDPMRGLG